MTTEKETKEKSLPAGYMVVGEYVLMNKHKVKRIEHEIKKALRDGEIKEPKGWNKEVLKRYFKAGGLVLDADGNEVDEIKV